MSKVTRLTLDEEGGLQNRRIHLREISGDLDAPLETVGQDLRTARLRRGDDLATVSRVLKIRKDHLEALEEDRLEALPGRTYAVGFVRSYAEYLGLDAVQCVERFKSEIAGRSDNIIPVQVIEEDEHNRLPQGWIIIACVVIVGLIVGAYQLWVSADRMLNQPVTPPPPQVAVRSEAPKPAKPVPQTLPTQTQTATVAPAQGTTTTLPVNQTVPGSQTVTAPPVNSSNATAPGGQTAAQTAAAPTGTVANTVPAQTQEAPLPPGQVYGAQNRNSRVILLVHQTTRILVQGPNRRVFINRTLRPGDTYQVPNQVGITLTTTDGSAVEIQLDGARAGYAGGSQQTIDALSLDPQAVMDRYNGGRG